MLPLKDIFLSNDIVTPLLPLLEKHFELKEEYINDELRWKQQATRSAELFMYFQDKPHLKYLIDLPFIPESICTSVELRNAKQYIEKITQEVEERIKKEGGQAFFRLSNYDRFSTALDSVDFEHQEGANTIGICLVILGHFYNKISTAHTTDDIQAIAHQQTISSKTYYNTNIRPELLELFLFCKDWKTIVTDEPITLLYKNKKLELKNDEGWFFNLLDKHLQSIGLGDYSVEEAKEELEELQKTYNKKAGRKPLNPHHMLIIKGMDSLWQEVFDTTAISNSECQLIVNFLNYIDPTTFEIDHSDNIKNIRSRISSLRKSNPKVDWFNNELDGYYMDWIS